MLNNNENIPLAGHDWLRAVEMRGLEQGDEMNRNKANVVVKIEKQETEMPEFGQIQMVPTEGAPHLQHDIKMVQMVQCDPNQMVHSGAFPEQASQTMYNDQGLQQFGQANQGLIFFPPFENVVGSVLAANTNQVIRGDEMLLQNWPLLHAPPSFGGVSMPTLNHFPISNNQPSEASWLMPQENTGLSSTRFFVKQSNPAANYPVEGLVVDMSLNSSNMEYIRGNDITEYFMNQHIMTATARPEIIVNPHQSAAFNNYQTGIFGGQEACYSNSFYPWPTGMLTPLYSNQVVNVEDSCYPPLMYYNPEPLNEPRKRQLMKQRVLKDGEDPMDIMTKEFLDTLQDLSGQGPSSSSSSSLRRHRRRANKNPPLYGIRNKASNFHVDPILRAFVTAMNQTDANYRNCRDM